MLMYFSNSQIYEKLLFGTMSKKEWQLLVVFANNKNITSYFTIYLVHILLELSVCNYLSLLCGSHQTLVSYILTMIWSIII